MAWQSYESLTQVVFQSIIDQKQFPNLNVQRDVILQGKTTSHQIDVYWQFEVGGIPHEVIVQAKDWDRPVNQGELLKFKGVLDDLPGQPKGVFVTRSGYQQGAKNFALANGIVLYELKEWEQLPTAGIVVGGWARYHLIYMPLHAGIAKQGEAFDTKNLFAWGFNYDICTPNFSDFNLGVSTSWLQQEYPTMDLSTVKRLEHPLTLLTAMTLHNEEGTSIGDLYKLFCGLITEMRDKEIDEKRFSHTFAEPTFLRVPTAAIPYIKLESVSFTTTITHRDETRRLKMSNFAQIVLHELNQDRSWFFAASPSVIESVVS